MTIYTKLLAARQDMGHFDKGGKHAQGWKYFQGDVVLEQVGDALAENGVLFLPCQTSVQTSTAEETDANGKTKTVETALVAFDMKFIDVETGEVLSVPTHGSARDYGDKALFKAQTLAIKYLFLRMFLKGEGDGEDPDAESTPPARKPASKPAAPPAAPKSNGQPANGGQEDPHWSLKPDLRGNFDRAMTNNAITETMIKVAMGADDPGASLESLLLGYSTVGEAIAAVLTYAREHAAS